MTHRTLTTLGAAMMAAILITPAIADTDLSENETSFTGARMLEGDVDVTFGGYDIGTWGDEDDERYAFFSGNTLYMGAEDADGNTVDAIVEFFWFESSIDRGSDFYLAVIKVRNTPEIDDSELVVDEAPVVWVYADTDLSTGENAFRWDWSVPFETYGIDSYGEATLKTEYGIGLNAEGAAMAGETTEEDGTKVEGNIQVKGYVDNEYKIQTQFQINLWSWTMYVHGTPGSMEWELSLNTAMRNDQSAYHEMFLVMQADEGVPFVMDSLEVGGEVQDNWWWWLESDLDIAVTDLVLTRPESVEDEIEDDGELDSDDDDDAEGDAEGDDETRDENDDVNGDNGSPIVGGIGDNGSEDVMACNAGTTHAAPAGAALTALVLAYTLLRRRIRLAV
jgi:hypothetical protein